VATYEERADIGEHRQNERHHHYIVLVGAASEARQLDDFPLEF
jgi:hypothetical protein